MSKTTLGASLQDADDVDFIGALTNGARLFDGMPMVMPLAPARADTGKPLVPTSRVREEAADEQA
ncbi:TPA: hypothetical protein UOJ25_000195 [Stenotrophomonas maltophilia]|nr:hypothetical protein [Stenotrophomonas maltophilia]